MALITKKIENKLNAHLTNEAYSSSLYRAMGSWCDSKGYPASASYLNDKAKEELTHLERFINHINERNGLAIIPAIAQPPSEFNDLSEIFNKALEHEQKITAQIIEMYEYVCDVEEDRQAKMFLQEFIKEQTEEEAGALDIVHICERVGGDMKNHWIEIELQKLNK